jgi:hypothetical protein
VHQAAATGMDQIKMKSTLNDGLLRSTALVNVHFETRQAEKGDSEFIRLLEAFLGM